MANVTTVVVQHSFDRINSRVQHNVGKVVLATAAKIVAHAQQSMGGVIPPSAPGRPPAIRTGFLKASGHAVQLNDLTAAAAFDSEYAPHLELGTIYMAPRPFLMPAVRYYQGEFLDAVMVALTT